MTSITDLCLKIAKENGPFFPEEKNVFRALELTPNPKVIILGQDPYHGEGEANGLAFGINQNIKIPPSLRNILKELKNDLGIECQNLSLEGWANRGVLLLNTVLTVKPNRPGSHFGIGWEIFTDEIIKQHADTGNKVFILWGKKAQLKKSLINPNKNCILESNHPSPLSANRGGFFGTKPFSKANAFLESIGEEPIDWSK
jgi:uracil-DNA glycosylase